MLGSNEDSTNAVRYHSSIFVSVLRNAVKGIFAPFHWRMRLYVTVRYMSFCHVINFLLVHIDTSSDRRKLLFLF